MHENNIRSNAWNALHFYEHENGFKFPYNRQFYTVRFGTTFVCPVLCCAALQSSLRRTVPCECVLCVRHPYFVVLRNRL